MLKIFAGILLICSTFSWIYAGEEAKKTDAQLREEYMKKDLATLKDLGEPRLSRSGESCLILLGDTQTYTPKMQNQGILDLMTSWIAANAKRLNIKGVVGVGDIVEHNGTLHTPHGSRRLRIRFCETHLPGLPGPAPNRTWTPRSAGSPSRRSHRPYHRYPSWLPPAPPWSAPFLWLWPFRP